MNSQDKREFADMLVDVATVYDKPEPGKAKLSAFWSILKKYPLEAVSAAIESHYADTENGRYAPTPAHLVAQIKKIVDAASNRPAADEAWAIALRSTDENETVVWTDEIAQAFGAARDILNLGDKVGARMAFKAAYERAVTDKPAKWVVSLGVDPERRREALVDAQNKGLLSVEQAARFLPAPAVTKQGAALAGLLSGKVVEVSAGEFKKHLDSVRSAIQR